MHCKGLLVVYFHFNYYYNDNIISNNTITMINNNNNNDTNALDYQTHRVSYHDNYIFIFELNNNYKNVYTDFSVSQIMSHQTKQLYKICIIDLSHHALFASLLLTVI